MINNFKKIKFDSSDLEIIFNCKHYPKNIIYIKDLF